MTFEKAAEIVDTLLAWKKKPVHGESAEDIFWDDAEFDAQESEFESGIMDDKFTGFEDFALLCSNGLITRVPECNTAGRVGDAQEPDFALSRI